MTITDPTREQKNQTHTVSITSLARLAESRFSSADEARDDAIPTGYCDFDRVTGGLRRGALAAISGDAAGCPFTLSLNFARRIATNPGGKCRNVLIISTQATASYLARRLLENNAGSPVLHDLPFFIDDSTRPSVAEIREKAQELHRRLIGQGDDGLSLLVIDDIQSIAKGSSGSYGEKRSDSVLGGLRELAQELRIGVLLVCQRKQASHDGAGIFRLQWQRAVERNAGLIVYSAPALDRAPTQGEAKGAEMMELNILRNRNGPIGNLTLSFVRKAGIFQDHA